jgi:hypothetical protein
MPLFVVIEREWPVLRFEAPTDPRFRVVGEFTDDREEEALELLDGLLQQVPRGRPASASDVRAAGDSGASD